MKQIWLTLAVGLSNIAMVEAAYNGTPVTPSKVSAENYADYGLTADQSAQYLGYYAISTAEELYGFAALVNGGETSANALLAADITVNEGVLNADGTLGAGTYEDWTPIGNKSVPFAGNFDGRGYAISGLYRNNASDTYVGLFGSVGPTSGFSTIKDITLKDTYFCTDDYTGGFAGSAKRTNFYRCFSYATTGLKSKSGYSGGIVGSIDKGRVENCGVAGKVNGYYYTGGLVGFHSSDTLYLRNNHSIAQVTGTYYGVAALLGMHSGGMLYISNNYYLDRCAYDDKAYQNGVGNGSQGSPTADIPIRARAMSQEDFHSGRVTWMLNKGVTDGTQYWYQSIGTDTIPMVSGSSVPEGQRSKAVYASLPCESTFANSQEALTHHYDNGFCTVCDGYEPATLASDGYYEISNGGQLYWFAAQVNGLRCIHYRTDWYWTDDNNIKANLALNARLTEDITVNTGVLDAEGGLNAAVSKESFRTWAPIGYYYYNNALIYGGNFDGQGHSISGLYYEYNSNTNTHIGLIGYMQTDEVNNKLEVKDVRLEDSYFVGKNYLGGFVGRAKNVKFSRCYFSSSLGIKGTSSYLGGIVGYTHGCAFESCGASGHVNGNINTGGLVGYHYADTIRMSNSYSAAIVKGNGFGTGSLIGSISGGIYSLSNNFYLENSAHDSRINQNGVGSGSTGQSKEDNPNRTCAKTMDDFRSGNVAWLLNGRKSEGVTWVQELGVDTVPGLSKVEGQRSKVVYASLPCESTYANSQTALGHHYDNGFCTGCDDYEPATLAADGTYEIANGGQLYWFAKRVNGGYCYLYRNKWWFTTNYSLAADPTLNARLTADITINEGVLDKGKVTTDAQKLQSFRWWEPMGRNESVTWYGKFDGQYHRIAGLYTDYLSTSNYSGLFGCIISPSSTTRIEIKNLTIEDSYLSGKQYVGGICGQSKYADLQECMNFAHVQASVNYVGGIAGWFEASSISHSGNGGYVAGNQTVAGVIAEFTNSDMNCTDCFNVGKVQGNGYRVAALVASYGGKNYASNNFYLENSAHDGSVYQNGYGANSKGSTSSDNPAVFRAMQREDFLSGRVTWLLNHRRADTVSWYQELGVDTIPMSSKVGGQRSKVVYASLPCESTFYNDQRSLNHLYANGFCVGCDDYEPATLAADGYYEIGNGGQLYWFATQVNGSLRYKYRGSWYWKSICTPDATLKGRLTADIKVNEGVLDNGMVTTDSDRKAAFRWWEPIGRNSDIVWSGCFDGNHHSISGLFTNYSSSTSDIGLFGYVKAANTTDSIVIKDMTVADSYFAGASEIGGIVGMAYNNTYISGCVNYAHIKGSGGSIGGIVGWLQKGSVTHSGNAGYVEGNRFVAGVVGQCANSDMKISNSYNYGKVQGDGYRVAAICAGYSGINYAHHNYYLENSAYDGKVYQYGYGVGTQGQNTGGENPRYYQMKTRDAFRSGEVTWLLNGGVTDGTQYWYQSIGTDTIPMISSSNVPEGQKSKVVYASQPCPAGFSNNPASVGHRYKNGFCEVCDDYEPATLAEDGYYEIGNGGQLYWFAKQVNGGYGKYHMGSWYWTSEGSAQSTLNGRLTADVSVNEHVLENDTLTTDTELRKNFRYWYPIGASYYNSSATFGGNFDGQYHTISGLYHSSGSSTKDGVFGYALGTSEDERTFIKNLRLEDSYFASKGYLGGIVGYAQFCNLSCLQNGAALVCYGNETGGIVGYPVKSNISTCGNTGRIIGERQVGGIAGSVQSSGPISNCYSTGTIHATDLACGAIIGLNYSSLCTNCYYLEGSASDSKVTQYGAGYGSNGTTVKDIVGRTIPMSASQFTKGEVCYRLNGSWTGIGTASAEWHAGEIDQENGTSANGWYQTLAESKVPLPDESGSLPVSPLLGKFFVNPDENGVYPILVIDDEIEYELDEEVEIKVAKVEYVRPQLTGRMWGTLCLPFEISSDDEAQYYAFNSCDLSKGMMNFKRVQTVSAGTPVLYLRKNRNENLVATGTNVTLMKYTGEDIATNSGEWNFKGTYSEIESMNPNAEENEGKAIYYISNNTVWHAVNAFRIPPYRAWFETTAASEQGPGGMGGSAFRSFGINIIEDMDGTRLDEEIIVNDDGSVQIPMDLLGRYISQPKSGQIYIQNGKKNILK